MYTEYNINYVFYCGAWSKLFERYHPRLSFIHLIYLPEILENSYNRVKGNKGQKVVLMLWGQLQKIRVHVGKRQGTHEHTRKQCPSREMYVVLSPHFSLHA